MMSRFPVAFRPPAFASWSSVPRWGLGLPHGRLTGHDIVAGPHRGSHVPHARDATGVGAFCTPGTAVLTRPTRNPRPPPAASQRPAPIPRSSVPSGEAHA